MRTMNPQETIATDAKEEWRGVSETLEAEPAERAGEETGAGSSPLSTYLVRAGENFALLAPEWEELFDRSNCDNLCQSYEWMHAWWEEWGGTTGLFLILVREPGGRLVGIAPFCITPDVQLGFSRRVLGFLGATEVCGDHLDILVEPRFESDAAQAIAGLLMAHQREWTYLKFADANAESPALTALIRALEEGGMILHREPAAICPYVPLPESYPQLLAGLSGSMRKNLRRYRRDLAPHGPVEMRCVSGPVEIEEAFTELMRLHELRFRGLSKPSSFLKPRLQAFHRRLLLPTALRGWVRIYLLCVGGKTVSALYGFAVRRRFFHYQAGMDPAWAQNGVGALCIQGVMEDCIDKGDREYDFLRGNEEYKSYWTRISRQDCTFRLFDRGLAGRLELGRLAMRERVRAVKKRVQAGFRTQQK